VTTEVPEFLATEPEHAALIITKQAKETYTEQVQSGLHENSYFFRIDLI